MRQSQIRRPTLAEMHSDLIKQRREAADKRAAHDADRAHERQVQADVEENDDKVAAKDDEALLVGVKKRVERRAARVARRPLAMVLSRAHGSVLGAASLGPRPRRVLSMR